MSEVCCGRPRFFLLFIVSVVAMMGVVHVYIGQIAEENAYLGMKPWIVTEWNVGAMLIGFPLFLFSQRKFSGRPSDFFLLVYSGVGIFSYLSLSPVSGALQDSHAILGLVIMFLPIFVVLIFRALIPKISWFGLIDRKWVNAAMITLTMIAVFLAYLNPTSLAGFGLNDAYERRLEGRDVYAAGGFLAYVLSMSMNGFVPYLAFRAGLDSIRMLFLFAVGVTIFFFYLQGVKAPFLYVFVAYGLGIAYGSRRILKKISLTPLLFYTSIVAIWGLVGIEWMLFDGYSYTADYFVRRLFPVQSEIQGYFIDFIFAEHPNSWSPWLGNAFQEFSPTYYIGENYLNSPEMNANTNAFLYGYAAGGLFGYIASLIIPAALFSILDRLYKLTANPSYVFIGFIYGALLVEQAFTTALVSSGVLVIFGLTLLERSRSVSIERSNISTISE